MQCTQSERNGTTTAAGTTAKLLTAVLVLQGLTLLGQWTGQPRGASEALAASPHDRDPASQRAQSVEELKAVNAKLEKLVTLLESGKLRVTVDAKK